MMELGELRGADGRDRGAMFGVLPRILSAKQLPPDGRNRLRLGLRRLDRAGGVVGKDGALAFPKARLHLQRRKREWAHQPTQRDRGSLPTDGGTRGLKCVGPVGGGLTACTVRAEKHKFAVDRESLP